MTFKKTGDAQKTGEPFPAKKQEKSENPSGKKSEKKVEKR